MGEALRGRLSGRRLSGGRLSGEMLSVRRLSGRRLSGRGLSERRLSGRRLSGGMTRRGEVLDVGSLGGGRSRGGGPGRRSRSENTVSPHSHPHLYTMLWAVLMYGFHYLTSATE